MGVEIERKFRIIKELFHPQSTGIKVRQGYLPQGGGPLLVRIRQQDDKAFITLKGPTTGVTRAEYEYPIPLRDAKELLQLCEKPLIEKIRYKESAGDDHLWEIDVFSGANEGLIIAELELRAENEAFTLPEWLGEEVTGDPRYYNSNLAKLPYCKWSPDEQ